MTYENSKPESFLREFSDLCNKRITEIHIGNISRSTCRKWRLLVVYLGLKAIVVSDIEREVTSEEERRSNFFSLWRNEKGTGATYRTLIEALLEINCGSDAEYVCDLLEKSARESPPSPVGTRVQGI